MTNYTSCSCVPVLSWCSFYLHSFPSVEAVSVSPTVLRVNFSFPNPISLYLSHLLLSSPLGEGPGHEELDLLLSGCRVNCEESAVNGVVVWGG